MITKKNKRFEKSDKKRYEIPENDPQYHFFYSTSSPFSNFHPAPFVDEQGNYFFCSEQYMMYQKAILFGDSETAKEILAEESEPKNCKRLGRRVQNFDDEIWGSNARRIVAEGVYFKFTQNPSMKKVLLETNNMKLVEAAPQDRVWGIGYSEAKALLVPRNRWGKNWLGSVLMGVRERIQMEDIVE
jgi:hypothetical protein